MANISSVNLPDGSSYNFKDSVSGYITSPNVVYCTCSTAAATAAKVATVVAGTFTSADLVAGAQVLVKFTYANTIASPTLNVNSTGAIYIKRYGTTAPSTSAATSWNAGSVVMLTYDGTYWQQVGFLNSTYSEISVANITNGSGSTTGLITGRRAKSAVEAFAPVTSVNGSTGAVTVSVPTKTSDLTNDSGYITGYTETDPTVPSWAKASTKPSYTASEVGAQPTLVSGTNIKTINGNSILGSGNLVISGGGSEPTMQTLSVTSGGSGTWYYRTWPSGWQEAWYQGSIQFTSAASTAGGWYRSTMNFALPISFADNASILVSGATSGRVFTHGGIKTNGTQFEAQILGGAALAANTYSGWSVYVAGYGRS